MIQSNLEFIISVTRDHFYYLLRALVNLAMPLIKGENDRNVPFHIPHKKIED